MSGNGAADGQRETKLSIINKIINPVDSFRGG